MGFSVTDFYTKDGTFSKCFKGAIKEHLERIKSGGPIGLTVKQAVDKQLLIEGDIVTFKDSDTHIFVYSGNKYLVYDGGVAANYPADGILVDYSKKNAGRKIREVLRWKD